ncbi:LLM class flavin-dependent oxidoreductase [Marinibaculum pumilum]|uniref:LLM class flavin-dependent oxidoreductase n=1 Tax=Marinibaculum pumilum TaxID=1766165 RepID=A0ABV7L4P1_9PROT
MVRLSVLDQSPIAAGRKPADAWAESLELARACDRLGYHRYWLAEHHATPALACSAPEIMIARIAGETRNMRIGAGGVMLSHYSPLKVAEQFRMLELMFPGRIDLGIGRAPGSDGLTAVALASGPNGYSDGRFDPRHFPRQVADLVGYLTDAMPAEHPFAHIAAMPVGPDAPPVWMLGSSDQSAQVAALLGTSFCFAHFIGGDAGAEVTAMYRKLFRPSALQQAPATSVGTFVLVAESQEEADRLARSRDLFLLRLRQGRHLPYPTPEAAEAHDYSAAEAAIVADGRSRAIVGTPEAVRAGIEELARAFGTEEVVALTICHDFGARLRSYELLAEAFGLDRIAA